ncbi:MAG: peptidyl-prolyl cis-trans isomerase [Xanthomonadales bacterium]|nr:peptidyl-prolyl cis-trans isomerase [Xanthomonadales bacterium]
MNKLLRFLRAGIGRTLLPVLAVALAGCEQAQEEAPVSQLDFSHLEGDTLARVNGEAIPESLLLAYLRTRGQLDANAEQRQAALNELVDLVLLTDEARRSGLLERDSLQALLAVQRLSLVANQVIQNYAQGNPISDQEIQAEYNDTVATTGDQEFRLRHILVEDEDTARTLLERMQGGEDYASVEAEQAAQRDSSVAGEIGWVNLSQVPPSFAPALSRLEPGNHTSEPVASPYGVHILFLEDRREFAPPDLQEVQAGIRNTLARERIEGYLSELRDAADVQLNAPGAGQ